VTTTDSHSSSQLNLQLLLPYNLTNTANMSEPNANDAQVSHHQALFLANPTSKL